MCLSSEYFLLLFSDNSVDFYSLLAFVLFRSFVDDPLFFTWTVVDLLHVIKIFAKIFLAYGSLYRFIFCNREFTFKNNQLWRVLLPGR